MENEIGDYSDLNLRLLKEKIVTLEDVYDFTQKQSKDLIFIIIKNITSLDVKDSLLTFSFSVLLEKKE